MKVGIVTVFKTENPGSFFQAWALQHKINELGAEASFVDYKSSPGKRVRYVKELVKNCIKLKFYKAYNSLKRTRKYLKHLKENGMESRNAHADMYVYGSDTIWNFQDGFFSEKSGFFTGENISAPRYAYAASAGSTSKDVFYRHKTACDAIRNFNGIAVRDEWTENLVEGLGYGKEIFRVSDPTLLYPCSEYKKHFYDTKKKKNNIFLIYYFGAVPKDTMKEIQMFAKEKGLQVIRLCVPDKKDGSEVLVEPQSFIQYYADAEYVFTNTFHGCAFSVIFKKNFATDVKDKKKVLDLMTRFELQERLITKSEQIREVYKNTIDFTKVDDILKKDVILSGQYLRKIVQKEEH